MGGCEETEQVLLSQTLALLCCEMDPTIQGSGELGKCDQDVRVSPGKEQKAAAGHHLQLFSESGLCVLILHVCSSLGLRASFFLIRFVLVHTFISS